MESVENTKAKSPMGRWISHKPVDSANAIIAWSLGKLLHVRRLGAKLGGTRMSRFTYGRSRKGSASARPRPRSSATRLLTSAATSLMRRAVCFALVWNHRKQTIATNTPAVKKSASSNHRTPLSSRGHRPMKLLSQRSAGVSPKADTARFQLSRCLPLAPQYSLKQIDDGECLSRWQRDQSMPPVVDPARCNVQVSRQGLSTVFMKGYLDESLVALLLHEVIPQFDGNGNLGSKPHAGRGISAEPGAAQAESR